MYDILSKGAHDQHEWAHLVEGTAVTYEQNKENDESTQQIRRLTMNTTLGITRLFTKFLTIIIFNQANWLKLMNSRANRFEYPSGYRISSMRFLVAFLSPFRQMTV